MSFVVSFTSVSVVPLCSRRAKWSNEAVTVAGFSNGTSSTSLAGLNYPSDLFIDSIGNMYIADFMNNRIVCWPVNARSGVLVANTNQPVALTGNLHE